MENADESTPVIRKAMRASVTFPMHFSMADITGVMIQKVHFFARQKYAFRAKMSRLRSSPERNSMTMTTSSYYCLCRIYH